MTNRRLRLRTLSDVEPRALTTTRGETIVRLKEVAVLAHRVVAKALRDEVAPASDCSCRWTLDDGGYPAELSRLADALDGLTRDGIFYLGDVAPVRSEDDA
jgi:hypothetical protein